MPIKIPSQFETKRLILRPYRVGDGQAFFDMVENGNRVHLKDILGNITESNDINKIENWIKELASDWNRHNRFVLSYWQKTTQNFLGHIWIEPIDWNLPAFEIGWFIDKNQQGKGYVTEATKKAIDFIFKDLQADNIIVRVRETKPYNIKSKNVAERCGFKKEGFYQDNIKLEDRTLISETHYKMLKEDYVNNEN
ncbi:MAG: GNAT family N-acetyltransferase [Candidatus Thorarchaeota archaeon]